MGKTLILIGLGIAALGLLVMLGVPLGRLPGDFYVRRGSFSFYFPLTTSIILSILLTLALAYFRCWGLTPNDRRPTTKPYVNQSRYVDCPDRERAQDDRA